MRQTRQTGCISTGLHRSRLAPIASKAQHHHEQVDEIEVERQRADDGLAACGSWIVVAVVYRLDSLSIVGSETRKDTDAYNRDQPVKFSRPQEEVEQACDDDADQAQEKEGAESRQVAPGG